MTGFQLRRSLFDETILQLQSMQRHASNFQNSRAPKREPLPGARQPGPVGQHDRDGRAERWLQEADRFFACQFSCTDPCNATNQPSRIPSPQARAAAGRPPAGPAGRPKARGASGVQLRIADRLFARQCHCSNPCNATHQASRIPRPKARGAAGEPASRETEAEEELPAADNSWEVRMPSRFKRCRQKINYLLLTTII